MKKQTSFLSSHKHSFKVAILGSPNVGKSTLFNILTESRDALVKDQPGVTRDIHIGQVRWNHHQFEVLDTGGLTDQKNSDFSALIKNKIQEVISFVDCLIVVMDGRLGLCPEDISVVELARKANKPFLIVVNKIDNIKNWNLLQADFFQLGGLVYPAAFEKKNGCFRNFRLGCFSSFFLQSHKVFNYTQACFSMYWQTKCRKKLSL